MDKRTPLAIALPAALGGLFLLLPLGALMWRAPLRRLPGLLAEPLVLDALTLSLVSATIATMLSVIMGVPLAWVLARRDFPGRSLIRGVVMVPLVLPPVVGGVALLLAYGRRGVIGEPLGLSIPFTSVAVVLAQTFVAMPFLVIAVEGALRSANRDFDEAAATLGANTWRTFTQVTLPLVRPAVIAGAVLAWARALGEFGATITFAGNLPGVTQTMPVSVYSAMQTKPEAALALSVVLLAVSLLVMVSLRSRWLR